MPSCEHDIQENPHGVNVRPLVGLGNPVLLRRGVARGSQNLRVAAVFPFEDPGSVKVNEYRLTARIITFSGLMSR